jgi:outer membrane immunogenic protein
MISKLTKMGIATLALLAVPFSANAADMPVKGYYKGPPRSVVSYYNWTGFYVGINGGYVWGNVDYTGAGGNTFSTSPKGWLLGGTLGYNYQTGAWVWGVEGDYNWMDLDGADASIICGTTCSIKHTWLATARGRVGYAFDRWLPYLTGGAAFGRINFGNASGTVDETRTGWTAGVGVEYAFLGNWTAKLEYLHVDLGSATCEVSICAGTGTGLSADVTADVVRAGLNYKFSGPLFSRF